MTDGDGVINGVTEVLGCGLRDGVLDGRGLDWDADGDGDGLDAGAVELGAGAGVVAG